MIIYCHAGQPSVWKHGGQVSASPPQGDIIPQDSNVTGSGQRPAEGLCGHILLILHQKIPYLIPLSPFLTGTTYHHHHHHHHHHHLGVNKCTLPRPWWACVFVKPHLHVYPCRLSSEHLEGYRLNQNLRNMHVCVCVCVKICAMKGCHNE